MNTCCICGYAWVQRGARRSPKCPCCSSLVWDDTSRQIDPKKKKKCADKLAGKKKKRPPGGTDAPSSTFDDTRERCGIELNTSVCDEYSYPWDARIHSFCRTMVMRRGKKAWRLRREVDAKMVRKVRREWDNKCIDALFRGGKIEN